MNIRPLRGTSGAERKQHFFFDFQEQWSSLLKPGEHNWLDFTVIRLQGEYAAYTGRWEVEVGLLGLMLTITYVFDHSFNDEMLRRVDVIKTERAEMGKEVKS